MLGFVIGAHRDALVVQKSWILAVGKVLLRIGHVVVETTRGQVLDWLFHGVGAAVDAARPFSGEVGSRVLDARSQVMPGPVADLELAVFGYRGLPRNHDGKEGVVRQLVGKFCLQGGGWGPKERIKSLVQK